MLSYEQTSIASPFPTHLGRHITRCPKCIHTAVVFSRAGDTRAHPWTFALFAFTTFTEQQKIRTIFNPKTEDKNRAKNILHFHKNVGDSHKNVGDFLKNVGRFFLKYSEFLPTQPSPFVLSATKIEGKSPISLKRPSFYLLFSIASTENPSVILPQNPPFQPSISPFQPAFS